jgi:hypothetical protein
VETLVEDMYTVYLGGYLPEGARVPADAGGGAAGESQPIWRTA